jgi:succinyl-CoA synthetase alpha subunit
MEAALAVRAVIKLSLYHDSVTLMNIARELRAVPGIDDAALVMGTDANKGLLSQADLLTPEAKSASSDDLVIVVKGDETSVDRALELGEGLLARGLIRKAEISEHVPKSIRGAIRFMGSPSVSVISVAGQYAADEAWQALAQGSHVLLFSDNVSLRDEIELKSYAVDNGLLLMGPGAGTAIINGVGLGFANHVPRGPVGILSAAGTGLQEVSTLLAREGSGVSQGIGLGGRDLSDEVGGLMMFHVLEALQRDPQTEVLVAISKLPSAEIAARVEGELAAGEKPAVVMFMGGDETAKAGAKTKGNLYRAGTLHEASLIAAALSERKSPAAAHKKYARKVGDTQKKAQAMRSKSNSGQKYLRGLFSGGTLCDETILIWSKHVSPIWSNRPRSPEFNLPDVHKSREHCALDLGEEEFTIGRPHPMIDQDLRLRRILSEAADPEVAVIQLDVVLGYGAHHDPASELAAVIIESIRSAKDQGRELHVVASVTGTESDPQSLSRQQSILSEAGATVVESNAMAAHLAALIVAEGT